MASAIRSEFPDAEVDLVQGGKGDFIVQAEGILLWDKRQNGDEFPDTERIFAGLTGL